MANFFGNIKRTCSTSGFISSGNEWGMSTGQSCLSSADCPTYLYLDFDFVCTHQDIVICEDDNPFPHNCDHYCEDRMPCIDGCCSCSGDVLTEIFNYQNVCAPIYGGMGRNRAGIGK